MPAFHLRLTKDLNRMHTMETLHVSFYFLCQPVLTISFLLCLYFDVSKVFSRLSPINNFSIYHVNAVHVLLFFVHTDLMVYIF